jgi:hypothetical protein
LNATLSSLWAILVEYRDLGLAATALLGKGDQDTAEIVLNQRTELFAQFERLDGELSHTAWHKLPDFIALGRDTQSVDRELKSNLEKALLDLSKDVGRLVEARRTLKGYRSGESGDTYFTGMA